MKYMGSKNRIAKYIAPIIQSYVDRGCNGYLEAMVGGANMIDKIECDKKYGCDVNEYLIELLKYAKSNKLPEIISKDDYTSVRLNMDEYDKWYVGLVGFCASYNSKWFSGYANNVKTKNGEIRNYTDEAIRNLIKQSPKLDGINFKCCSFQNINTNISNYGILS